MVAKQSSESVIVLACSVANDLYAVLSSASGPAPPRVDTAREAVEAAPVGGAVAILAEGYPGTPTPLSEDVWSIASRKGLRLFIEYPAELSGLHVGPPERDSLLRGVVVSDGFGESLAPMRIVAVNACHHVPVAGHVAPSMVLARVAGMDTAVFGLADTPTTPLLFEHPDGGLLVATTKLSNFITARHMPAEAWRLIWRMILAWLVPDCNAVPPESEAPSSSAGFSGAQRRRPSGSENPRLPRTSPAADVPDLLWTPAVRPSFGREDPLPQDVEAQALGRVADWVVSSRLLRHPDWPRDTLELSHTVKAVSERPAADWPAGDGSLGILEGFTTAIREDGSQPVMYPVRDDCCCETAMLMAFDAAVSRRESHAKVAANLLDYVYVTSELVAGGKSPDPSDPSYGLVGWNLAHPDHYWGDDNARALLGSLAVASLLDERRWGAAIVRALLANFRTTGPRGHRPHCIKDADLKQNGWRHYWQLDKLENTAHMTAWLWPCFLWAHRQTGFTPFLERTEAGARALMEAYPKWDYVNGSGPLEMARALLPLAWLVRADDTPDHRRWLRRVAEDLIALQDVSGAIRETVRIGDGTYRNCIATSNTAYGTCETNLIQVDGEPVSDSLYTCNFALIGLHEAAAATGDSFYGQAADKLAAFLCRIQLRSEKHPELDGAWYRAFNFGNWDTWACCSDGDWGPWCVETGWTQPWIAAALALRRLKTSLWEVVGRCEIGAEFDAIRREMLPDEALDLAACRTLRSAQIPTRC